MTLDDKIIDAILSGKCTNIVRGYSEATLTFLDKATQTETTVFLKQYCPCSMATITVTREGEVILMLDRLRVSDTLCSFVEEIGKERAAGKDTTIQDYKAAIACIDGLV